MHRLLTQDCPDLNVIVWSEYFKSRCGILITTKICSIGYADEYNSYID